MRKTLAGVLLFAAACSQSPARTPPSLPNVLLITIDSLRADRVGRGLTPALDALAARGTTFTQARTAVPLTLPSHAAILTGSLPFDNGVRQDGDVLTVRPTLARAFHDAGYRTAAFVGAYVLDRRFGLAGGFDTYDDRVPRDPSGDARLDAERRGDVVAGAALAWLQERSTQPFFAWVHFYDPHAPYDPPRPFLARANGSAYDGEVAFADAQAGRLLEWLRSSGQEAATIVAVAGDHGEGLGDHGEATHGMLAYDSTLRVPLIVAMPSLGSSRLQAGGGGLQAGDGGLRAEADRPVSLADLAGTLLGQAGVPVPGGMRRGPLGHESTVYAETLSPRAAGWHALSALAFDQWKMVLSADAELYDVRADPGETRNRAGEMLAIVESARRRLPGPGAANGPVDDEAPNPARGIAAWNTLERERARLLDGDARGALPGLTRLARAYPDAPAFQSAYARALKDTGRAGEAVDLYHRLVTRWPQDAGLYHELGAAAAAAGMPAEAMRAERASLALQPSNAAAANGLGLILMTSGAAPDAVSAFERATGDDPSNAVFWTNLGNARREAGETARAEQAFMHALDLDPRSAAAANAMGVLLVQAHRAPEAIRWFERALAGAPRFADARLNLGRAYQESGNTEKAIDAYRRVLSEAAPGSREYLTASQLLAELTR